MTVFFLRKESILFYCNFFVSLTVHALKINLPIIKFIVYSIKFFSKFNCNNTQKLLGIFRSPYQTIPCKCYDMKNWAVLFLHLCQ